MSTNTELAAEIRAGSYEDRAWMMSALDRAADALEAAEAELTRRDTVIANAPHHYQCKLGDTVRGTNFESGCTCWKALAAAPVSLEAVKAETTTDPRASAWFNGWDACSIGQQRFRNPFRAGQAAGDNRG